MAGILKVDTIQTVSGSGNIIIDGSIGQISPTSLPAGSVINSGQIRYSTRAGLSSTNVSTYFSGNVTKISSSSKIIATCTVFGADYHSGNCGFGMHFNGVWDFGCGYQYDSGWTDGSQVTIANGTSVWTGVNAGTYTLGVGHKHYNGDTGKFCGIINPNSSDESRNRQHISTINWYEVA